MREASRTDGFMGGHNNQQQRTGSVAEGKCAWWTAQDFCFPDAASTGVICDTRSLPVRATTATSCGIHCGESQQQPATAAAAAAGSP